MARLLRRNAPKIWAVIEIRPDGTECDVAFGPYESEASAKSMLTRASGWDKWQTPEQRSTYEIVSAVLYWKGRSRG